MHSERLHFRVVLLFCLQAMYFLSIFSFAVICPAFTNPVDGVIQDNLLRSASVVQANVFYTGFCEMPAIIGDQEIPNGHVVAVRIYDPVNPGYMKKTKIWDAGEVLNQMNPGNRNIFFPKMTVARISDVTIATGNGSTKTFSGTLQHPVVATTVKISGQRETFSDAFSEKLTGNFGGTGNINRFNGLFEITFNAPPGVGESIQCSYAYYTAGSVLKMFNTNNVDNVLLALDDTSVIPNKYSYDLDGNSLFDESGGDFLVQWVRGYCDGSSTKKKWLLGAVDHSTPALVTPPGRPPWYYGIDITDNERAEFDLFSVANQYRRTVLYVGAGDGMIHAFDAGKFRWGDNPDTAIVEKRGYFEWVSLASDLSLDQRWKKLLGLVKINPPDFRWQTIKFGEKAPDYGSGEELWAFIPPNLIAKLKNNFLKKENPANLDVSPAVADVYINGEWRTILLAAEGNGGHRVFCLDITCPDKPFFRWEFADPDISFGQFSTTVAPIGKIVLGGIKRWVAFLKSGKTSQKTLDPSIYLIDMTDGSVIQRVFLHAGMDSDGDGMDDGAGGIPGGYPAIIDSDGNGYIDRLYMGTDKGFMFKVNIPDDPNFPGHTIDQCMINTDFFYDDDNGNIHFVPPDQQYLPIRVSPSVVVDNNYYESGEPEYNIRVFFGTGDSFYKDKGFKSAEPTFGCFAYRDRNSKNECHAGLVDLAWYKGLPPGHGIFASPFAAAGTIYFGSSTPETKDPSAVKSNGIIYALNMKNGKVFHAENVGSIISSLLVADEHLYFKTRVSGVKSSVIMGGDQYNNETVMSPDAINGVLSWKELW